MKNKAGVLGGFVLGIGGFLLLFKLLFLEKLGPDDELAPGMVVILSVITGLLLVFIGARIQHRLAR